MAAKPVSADAKERKRRERELKRFAVFEELAKVRGTPTDPLLDAKDLQLRLKCSRSVAYGLLERGPLAPHVVRLGTALRIPASRVELLVSGGGFPKAASNGHGAKVRTRRDA